MATPTQRKASLLQKAFGGKRHHKNSDWRQQLSPYFQTYLEQPGKPVWTPREYSRFAEDAYRKNVIAYRCITLIAQAAASMPWYLTQGQGSEKVELKTHPLLQLLAAPNPGTSGTQFIEALVSYRLLSGNAYMLMVAPEGSAPKELHLLRPDRVQILAGRGGIAEGYEYTVDGMTKRYLMNRITGHSAVLHLKNFNPMSDYYGMSPIEAAAYSIDQHNQAAQWNQALLQNGAKPSGALVVKMADDGSGGSLSEEQYTRIKAQVDEQYAGARNAGRPMLLEGGMEWKEMSLSPRDMDFIESKHSSARDIAQAFGVPPQMLGIPGDNTYGNLAEARLALWEQTILPMMDGLVSSLNQWLIPCFGMNLSLSYDEEQISALAPRREKIWARIGAAEFLTNEEKRQILGIEKVKNHKY